MPASAVATLNRWRGQVELFFRWLETLANFDHPTTHTREGVTTHLDVSRCECLRSTIGGAEKPARDVD